MKERSLFLMRAGRRWRSWQKFRERYCPPPDENKFMPEISQKRIFWRGNWISKSNMGGEKEKTWDVLAYLLPQSPSWHQFTTNYWQDKGGCTPQTRKDSESKEWKSWRCQPGQENVNYLEPNLELPTVDWLNCLCYLVTGQVYSLTSISGSQPDRSKGACSLMPPFTCKLSEYFHQHFDIERAELS